jgi:hypothetical protein
MSRRMRREAYRVDRRAGILGGEIATSLTAMRVTRKFRVVGNLGEQRLTVCKVACLPELP